MYKVNREAVPSYILDLFPPIVGDTNPYPLRNSQNLTIPYSRTAVSMKSCILSGINLWNYLDDSLKNRESLQSFNVSIVREDLGHLSNRISLGTKRIR